MDTIAFEILPGLEQVAEAELAEAFSGRQFSKIFDGEGEIVGSSTVALKEFLKLRTVVSVYLVVPFEVQRPRSLLAHEHIDRLHRVIERVRRSQNATAFHGIRIAAAGSDSDVMQRLLDSIGTACDLPVQPEEGDLLLRVRPGAYGGWEVLVRLTPRPLSTRKWRVENYRGALNATAAAAAVRLSQPHPTDRVLNLMCGSGTLLAERLLMGKCANALGIDISTEAIAAACKNLRAAGVGDRCELKTGDVFTMNHPGEHDVVFCDLPWGEAIGKRSGNKKLYAKCVALLSEVLAPRGRAIVVTQDDKTFDQALQPSQGQLEVVRRQRYFQGGFHPTLLLLARR